MCRERTGNKGRAYRPRLLLCSTVSIWGNCTNKGNTIRHSWPEAYSRLLLCTHSQNVQVFRTVLGPCVVKPACLVSQRKDLFVPLLGFPTNISTTKPQEQRIVGISLRVKSQGVPAGCLVTTQQRRDDPQSLLISSP